MIEDNPKAKVQGHPDFKRDLLSGAIVNENISEYEKYMDMMCIKKSQAKKIDRLEYEVNTIKNELSDIKNLLINLSSKL